MVQGILPLEIETGRYRSPKLSLNSRICILCSRLKKFSSTSWSSADIASKSLDLKWASAGHKVRKCTSSPTSSLLHMTQILELKESFGDLYIYQSRSQGGGYHAHRSIVSTRFLLCEQMVVSYIEFRRGCRLHCTETEATSRLRVVWYILYSRAPIFKFFQC